MWYEKDSNVHVQIIRIILWLILVQTIPLI